MPPRADRARLVRHPELRPRCAGQVPRLRPGARGPLRGEGGWLRAAAHARSHPCKLIAGRGSAAHDVESKATNRPAVAATSVVPYSTLATLARAIVAHHPPSYTVRIANTPYTGIASSTRSLRSFGSSAIASSARNQNAC